MLEFNQIQQTADEDDEDDDDVYELKQPQQRYQPKHIIYKHRGVVLKPFNHFGGIY